MELLCYIVMVAFWPICMREALLNNSFTVLVGGGVSDGIALSKEDLKEF